MTDFGHGHDRIDASAFGTRFRRLDTDNDGRLEDGEGRDGLSVSLDGGDLRLFYAGDSLTLLDVDHLEAEHFIF